MLSSESEAFVQELLARHAGLVFTPQQSQLLDSRLTSLAKTQGLDDANRLVAALKASPSSPLLDNVIDAVTTHETSFFRDQQAFLALKDELLPDLIARRRRTRALSIWSAGCSTGQEPYSLALLLLEQFPELANWQLNILGTDVSRAAVARARKGTYSALELRRGLGEAARDRYFERRESEWRVCDAVRRMVHWEVLNLTAGWPTLRSFDLVMMRNVLIYFTPEARSRILARTANHLARDGYLLLGISESTFGVSTAFETHVARGAIAFRKARF